jgi:Uma2 family endonuclease
MSTVASVPISTEELLAMPEDGVERELIYGELRERPMTRRNPVHSEAVIRIGHILMNWLGKQPKPRGRVLGGEAGFRLRRDPDTTVGIDVAYIDADLAARTAKKAKIVDGPPVLAVEILSPSDTQEAITEKVGEYLASGVALVWIVEPMFCTVQVYKPNQLPETFNSSQQLVADPHLPGFRVAVAEFFED